MLTIAQEKDLRQRGYSRRSFGRLATLFGAAATLPFYNEFSLAQAVDTRAMPAGAVKIDTNENPLGPCAEAREAMIAAVNEGGRYHFEYPKMLQDAIAQQEGVKPNYVLAYAGSSGPLHQAVLAFTSPTRSYVVADPGYEAGDNAAQFIGSPVVRVPLTSTFAHDVKAMVAKAPNAGLFYICNPNNPTGSMTSRSDIEWLIANKPAGSIVLLDEAYIHFSGVDGMTDVVAKDKDVVILRTFSKLYGMAGMRAAAVIARPDLIEKLRGYSANFLPSAAMIGAVASLKVKNLVPERRKLTKDTREDVLSFMAKHNFNAVPSLSNKFMVDVKRPGREVTTALRAHNVFVGRSWPIWPNHVRVTVGTQEEMNKFKTAFLKVTESVG